MSFNAQRCSTALNGVQLDTLRLDDVLRLATVQGGFYPLVAQRQVPGSRSSRATCHRRPALLSARARLGAECAVLYRVCASCRSAPASVATGTVILGLRAQQFSGSFIAAPAASIIALLPVGVRVHDPFPSRFIAACRRASCCRC